MAGVTRKANLYLFGIRISRVTQNDYDQYKFRLKAGRLQTSVFLKFSYNMPKVLRKINIWYHEKCTQRTFNMSKEKNKYMVS